jgi:hypothetical protein
VGHAALICPTAFGVFFAQISFGLRDREIYGYKSKKDDERNHNTDDVGIDINLDIFSHFFVLSAAEEFS